MRGKLHRLAARRRGLASGIGAAAALAAVAVAPASAHDVSTAKSTRSGSLVGHDLHGGSGVGRSWRPSDPERGRSPGGGSGAGGGSGHGTFFAPGDLLLSTSVYEEVHGLQPGVTQLAPGCAAECFTANATGQYPEVWNNDSADEDFGVTSKILLDQITPWGAQVNSLEVPNSTNPGVSASSNQMVTSFPSKSELALNLSTGGRYVTFMGYDAPVDSLDVSNSNTPGVVDPSNPDPGTAYRVVAQVDANGRFQFTETNAYSGNNGRAAILDEEEGANTYYLAGNAGNGKKPVPAGVVEGGGAQILAPSLEPESLQSPGAPTALGSFNVTELGAKADKKPSKDNNFRGIAVYGKVLYYTKGSGKNGVDTVYFVNTSGKGCEGGVGLPEADAQLPSSAIAPTAEGLAHEELAPTNMCILKGFPSGDGSTEMRPFGIWFANAHTIYVADEGNGENTYSEGAGQYTAAASQTLAGLQKWVFDEAAGEWKLAYTLSEGLELGDPYTVSGYPTGQNPFTGLPWAPATDGLRNLTGRVNPNGTATIWATTSTVSGDGDEGADPNRLVTITDPLEASSQAQGERFATLRTAGSGEVLRGVSFTPGTGVPQSGCGGRGHR